MTTIFITGFPGFIAKRLVQRFIAENHFDRYYFLVQEQFFRKAEREISEIKAHAQSAGQRMPEVRMLIGDITAQDLQMGSTWDHLTHTVTHVFHLAALYDLAAPFNRSWDINVLGTEHVLRFIKACKNRVIHYYVSTCYVSGMREGKIYEHELDKGQAFKNHYEHTKFEAEVRVRHTIKTIPTIIFRPSIVAGESTTGATDKYDGPYFVIKMLVNNKTRLPMVDLGASDAKIAVIPVDYLVNAMVAISINPTALGKTFQISDPNPLTAKEISNIFCQYLNYPKWPITIPKWLVNVCFRSRWIQSLTGIPYESIIYFNHRAEYMTTNTSHFLSGTGIECPPQESYLARLVDFVKQYPDAPPAIV